jgi:cytoskeleton protein RodZ
MATQPESDRPLEIGSILKETRQRLGIELATVEEQTKIRIKYLRALEDERWDVLPGPAYTRGFIRAYAETLGLDPELLVDEYRLRSEEAPTGTYELAEPVLRGRGGDGGPRQPIPGRMIAAAIAAVVLVLLLVLGVTAGDDDEQAPAEKDGKREARARPPARPDNVRLDLVARSDVQVCLVDAGGDVLIPNQLLGTGAEEGSYASKRLKVELDPAQARLLDHGKRLGIPLGEDPAAYVLTPGRARPTEFTGTLCP